jgi:hypothetical protein
MLSLILLLFSCVILYVWAREKSARRLPLPPGPPGDPLIGHLRLVPSDNQENIFYEWGKKYGMWAATCLTCFINNAFKAMSCISAFWDDP